MVAYLHPRSRRVVLRLAAGGAMTAALARSGIAPAVAQDVPAGWTAPNATFGAHGQLVVGDGPIYLSHFPMFMFDTPTRHPHHFQVILEVEFKAEHGDPTERYIADREASGATLYSFSPSASFRMIDLIAPAGTDTPVRSFPGALVRGHFEREGAETVADEVTVNVVRVVYAHEFEFDAAPPETIEYVLFGQGDTLFAAHRIIAPSSFDQVLPVTIDGHSLTDGQLLQGVILSIEDRTDTIADRLRDGDQVTSIARLRDRDEPIATGVAITAGQEIFFEDGELRFPDATFEPTEAEQEAGVES